jgi:hypothetical protein
MATYNTRHGITSNYSATANPHIAQITTAPAKTFPDCRVFTSSSLATASKSGDSSASSAHIFPSATPVQNCLPAIPQLTASPPIFFLITISHGPNRKHCFQQFLYCCLGRLLMYDSSKIVEVFSRFRVNLFTEQLPSNGSGIVHVFAEPLLRSGRTTTAVDTTICIL